MSGIEELRERLRQISRYVEEMGDAGIGGGGEEEPRPSGVHMNPSGVLESTAASLRERCAAAPGGERAAFRFFLPKNALGAVAVVPDGPDGGIRCADVRREHARWLVAHVDAARKKERPMAPPTDRELAPPTDRELEELFAKSPDRERRAFPYVRHLALGNVGTRPFQGVKGTIEYGSKHEINRIRILADRVWNGRMRDAVHYHSFGVWPDPQDTRWSGMPSVRVVRDILAGVDPFLLALARAFAHQGDVIDLPGGREARAWLARNPWAVEVRDRLASHPALEVLRMPPPEDTPEAAKYARGIAQDLPSTDDGTKGHVWRCNVVLDYLKRQEKCLEAMHAHVVPEHSGDVFERKGSRMPLSNDPVERLDDLSPDQGFGSWRDFFPTHLVAADPR